MRFKPAVCPKCGLYPCGMLERVPGIAELMDISDGGGEFDYAGYTKMDWDNQETVVDDEGRVTLVCGNRHSWQAEMDPSNEKEGADGD